MKGVLLGRKEKGSRTFWDSSKPDTHMGEFSLHPRSHTTFWQLCKCWCCFRIAENSIRGGREVQVGVRVRLWGYHMFEFPLTLSISLGPCVTLECLHRQDWSGQWRSSAVEQLSDEPFTPTKKEIRVWLTQRFAWLRTAVMDPKQTRGKS